MVTMMEEAMTPKRRVLEMGALVKPEESMSLEIGGINSTMEKERRAVGRRVVELKADR